ncbi:hypothetical protein DFQ00_11486 [Paenibacillus barcinonensis]|uniref:Immunity protein 17 of polymorphic toxin system n=1 Tax=Paenibacillus barcinonensis TaxID=198119 RepID=A0A2V4W879_PAEBA|nr:hypothetical protein DFQ00_11486 [Paenibacillus barcinonensis]
MFFFVVFLIISISGFIFGVRALLIPDSWPFNLNKRELDFNDLTNIRFRGIFLLALSIVCFTASLREL